jgi:hypothetical protein
MKSAHSIATALGRPQRVGRNKWRCVCPLHGGHSLELADGNTALLAKCWAGCDTRDVLIELRARGLLDPSDPRQQTIYRARETNNQLHNFAHDDRAREIARALEWWQAAQRIAGTLAETYLSTGACSHLPPEVNTVLRFHPACPFGKDDAGKYQKHPCLLALCRDIITDAPVAVQRVALKNDASKIGRMAYGPTQGAAIKLWAHDAVTTSLVVAEGIESALALAHRTWRGALLQPAWALIDAGHIKQFPVLPGIESLLILAERDDRDTGQQAAAECRARWQAAGRECEAITFRENDHG